MVLEADVLDVVVPLVGAVALRAGVGVLVDAEPGPMARGRVRIGVWKTDHPGVGRGQVLDGVEAEHGHIGLGAHVTSGQARAGHVRGIEDQLQATLAAQPHDGVELPGVAAEPDKDHRPCLRRDARLHRGRIEAQELVDVGEDGPQVLVEDRVVARHERQGRADDLVAVLPAVTFFEQAHREVEPRGR